MSDLEPLTSYVLEEYGRLSELAEEHQAIERASFTITTWTWFCVLLACASVWALALFVAWLAVDATT